VSPEWIPDRAARLVPPGELAAEILADETVSGLTFSGGEPMAQAYATAYRTETERRAAFGLWLHTYNHHRGHTALKGLPPASRIPNLTGQNI
jgi:transposase InsO family protein